MSDGMTAVRKIGGILFAEDSLPSHLLNAMTRAERRLEHAVGALARKQAQDQLAAARQELALAMAPAIAARVAPRGHGIEGLMALSRR